MRLLRPLRPLRSLTLMSLHPLPLQHPRHLHRLGSGDLALIRDAARRNCDRTRASRVATLLLRYQKRAT